MAISNRGTGEAAPGEQGKASGGLTKYLQPTKLARCGQEAECSPEITTVPLFLVTAKCFPSQFFLATLFILASFDS